LEDKLSYTNLHKYGLTERYEQEASLYEGFFLARITEQHRDLYKAVSEKGELQAAVSGKYAFSAGDVTEFPAVGDWVMLDREEDSSGNAVIHHLLRRKSVLERKAAGNTGAAQIIAANIDEIFICMSLNANFNLRRLERYLSIGWNSMANPVIVLTKSDLCENLEGRLAEISEVSMGAPVEVCSSFGGSGGYEGVRARISEGKTAAFIGSSGVGKSTLINRLLGYEALDTRDIRDDGRGRHATTSRQMLLLPGGGIVIDTPGMRELGIESGDLSKTFGDIEELAEMCRFRDCTHTAEPGCAVKQAVESGGLSEKRLASYMKLRKEMGYEGLTSRQVEELKIKNMFGGKGEMKQLMRHAKNKNK
jgi:ribosome biogenesis GTPase